MIEADIQHSFAQSPNNQTALAIQAHCQAIQQDPHNGIHYAQLGSVLYSIGEVEKACVLYRTAITLSPHHANLYYNLSAILHAQGEFQKAIESCQKAIALSEDNASYYNCLGLLWHKQRNISLAILALEKAVALQPQEAQYHYNLALIYLFAAEFEKGWKLYEYRFQCNSSPLNLRALPYPLWQAQDLRDKTIVIYAEQGFGDTLQFCRYLALLPAKEIILFAPSALKSLLSKAPYIHKVIDKIEELPHADYCTPLLSLPHILSKMGMPDVPTSVPYLFAPPDIRFTLPIAKEGHKKIGLVWAGKASNSNDHNRSCPIEYLKPLFDMACATFYSLQVGPRAAEITPFLTENVIDLSPLLPDFATTAAAMMQLDLIITVDTAVAHLAGALGRPSYVLLCYLADWRWHEEEEKCMWYPTARLFRQKTAGDWQELGERVARAIWQ